MFEGLVASILNKWLGKYVEDLDTENLNVGIFSGEARLNNLQLKAEALYELKLPIEVKFGVIGSINLIIPWSSLSSQAIVVNVEDVLILARSVGSAEYSAEKERKLIRALKKKILDDLEEEHFLGTGSGTLFDNLLTALTNNIQIFIRKVHLRYEDEFCNGGVICGLCIEGISMETTNSKWKPCTQPAGNSTVYQLAKLEAATVYFNAEIDKSDFLGDTWREDLKEGLQTFSIRGKTFDFLFKPFNAKMKTIVSRSTETRVPKLLVDLVVHDLVYHLSRAQLLSIIALIQLFDQINLRRNFLSFRPLCCVSGNTAKWWKYSLKAVLQQRVYPYQWKNIRKHRAFYREYKELFKKTALNPGDTELRLDLSRVEDNLELSSIVIAREHAKIEIKHQDPDRIEIISGEEKWWWFGQTSSNKFQIRPEKPRGIWAQLSQAERKKLIDIGKPDADFPVEKAKKYIEHKVNITVHHFSGSIFVRGNEIASMALSQLLGSFETRPAAHAFKISVRAESIVVEGATTEQGFLTPLINVAASSGNSTTNFLCVDFEKNPLGVEADYGVTVNLEQLEVVYYEHAFSEFLNFFQGVGVSQKLLKTNFSLFWNKIKEFKMMVEKRQIRVDLNMSVKTPYFVISESGTSQKSELVLVVDLGHWTFHTDLQTALCLDDVTQMELEERLYDRLHINLDGFQILFGDSGIKWKESLKLDDTEHHILSKARGQIVISSSFKPDYKLLPKSKLNVTLYNMKINVSDRRIVMFLDFLESLPLPSSNTVSVTPVIVWTQFENDVIQPDVNLNFQQIKNWVVSSELSRQRTPDHSNVTTPTLGVLPTDKTWSSVEVSDEDVELWARTVDLPGFDDNVSPNNVITSLLRMVVGEIVLVLSRSNDTTDKPYVMARISKCRLDAAFMVYGPAVQATLGGIQLIDKLHLGPSGEYLEIITTQSDADFISVLYRKVRSDCPDFKTHFHSVEQSLVLDIGVLALTIHREAILTFTKYLQYLCQKIAHKEVLSLIDLKHLKSLLPKSESKDPPIPPGAVKFSYSTHISEFRAKLCDTELEFLEIKVKGFESDCMFKANERMVLRAYLFFISVEDLSEVTLYPKVVAIEEDKVFELKYVRHSPRLYTKGLASGQDDVHSDGSLKLNLEKIHVVFVCKMAVDIQHFIEPLVPIGIIWQITGFIRKTITSQINQLKGWNARLHLSLHLNLPVLLIPQKSISPNLVVLNLGELSVENFFKGLIGFNLKEETPQVIDNILIKLESACLSRASVTLTENLEIQEEILEPIHVRFDMKRFVGGTSAMIKAGDSSKCRETPLFEIFGNLEPVKISFGQKDLSTFLSIWRDNFTHRKFLEISWWWKSASPVDGRTPTENDDLFVRKLQVFLSHSDACRKDTIARFTIDSVTIDLYNDIGEVLSSPVRDLNQGLCRLTLWEASFFLEKNYDNSIEMKMALQTCLLEDIRTDASVIVKKVFQSHHGGESKFDSTISISTPPIVDVSFKQTQTGERCVDILVEKTRLNLSVSFITALVKFTMDAIPVKKNEGGFINHGYVGDIGYKRRVPDGLKIPRLPLSGDSTSGYYSSGMSCATDEQSGLSVSLQCRKPELVIFSTGKRKTSAILFRSELLVDWSKHPGRDALVISLASLQAWSKTHPDLTSIRQKTVTILHQCDIEIARNVTSLDDGLKVTVMVSPIDLRLSVATVTTIVDIVEELQAAMVIKDGKNQPQGSQNVNDLEDLWSPKKISSFCEADSCAVESENLIPQQPSFPVGRPAESMKISIPKIKIVLEVPQGNHRRPLFLANVCFKSAAHDWSSSLNLRGELQIEAAYFNEDIGVWEPFIEPCIDEERIYRPWEIVFQVFQGKSFPISPHINFQNEQSNNKGRKVSSHTDELEDSETSGDESDQGMTFLKRQNFDTVQEVKKQNFSLSCGDSSDSENEDGALEKLTNAVGHLFTAGSSENELSESNTSATDDDIEEQEAITEEESASALSAAQERAVFLKKHSDSVDSGLETEAVERFAVHVLIHSKDRLEMTVTPSSIKVLQEISTAFSGSPSFPAANLSDSITVKNSLGPDTVVTLLTKTELSSYKPILVATYDRDVSPSSSHGSISPNLSPTSDWDTDDLEDSEKSANKSLLSNVFQYPRESVTKLYDRLTESHLLIKIPGFSDLKVVAPKITCSKMHALQPSRNQTRYHVILTTQQQFGFKKYSIRGPLQIRNDTSYAMGIYYKKSVIEALGEKLIGEATNPFEDMIRMAVIEPDDVLDVPLFIAYHCKLHFMPVHVSNYHISENGVSWQEMMTDMRTAKDLCCASKQEKDETVFSVKAFCEENPKKTNIKLSANCLIRLLPPLVISNLLPYAMEIKLPFIKYEVRVEAGEKTNIYSLNLQKPQKITIEIPEYLGITWAGSFSLTADLEEKILTMITEQDTDGGNKQLALSLRITRNSNVNVQVYCPYWIINKTRLPLQIRGSLSDFIHEWAGGDGPLLFCFRKQRRRYVRVRAFSSSWSSAFSLDTPGCSGLVICKDKERKRRYRILAQTHFSQMCPKLTKIISFLPNFIVTNTCKKHLRFMEDNERADLWIDIAPGQCLPFWPETDSMRMHVKFRDSKHISQHFPVTISHTTVLRMDKGCGITVVVTGSVDQPFSIRFQNYKPGDAPVRIDNQCEDLFLKFHQKESGQVALLSPYESLLYTWDDPSKERSLLWNVYNNKGKDFCVPFWKDGFGKERVSFHVVRQDQSASESMTAKLSAGLKRLTPKSPLPEENSSSGSDDSEEEAGKSQLPKKTRRDKIVVYWANYLEGDQRVLLFTQDERIAKKAKRALDAERSHLELFVSIAGLGMSLVNKDSQGVPRELLYFSLSDSAAQWEVTVAHRWKTVALELASWLEDKYKQGLLKAQIKDYIHIDFEKMQMTKPFFGELRRRHRPAIWIQYRRSRHMSLFHFQLHRMQLDNQLHEAEFPTVFYPVHRPVNSSKSDIRPALEIAYLKKYSQSCNDVFKFVKFVVQEHSLQLEKHWLCEVSQLLGTLRGEKTNSTKIRHDIALVHMPLSAVSAKSAYESGNENMFEYLHCSPIKLQVTFSSQVEQDSKEYFPNPFVDYFLFTLAPNFAQVKSITVKLLCFEIIGQLCNKNFVWDQGIQYFKSQFWQQIHVLIMGVKVLANPFSQFLDFSDDSHPLFYEPFLENTGVPEEFSEGISAGALGLLGHETGGPSGTATLFAALLGTALQTIIQHDGSKKKNLQNEVQQDLPESIINSPYNFSSVCPLALSGVIVKGNIKSEPLQGVEAFFKGPGKGLMGLMIKSTCGVINCLSMITDGLKRAIEMGESIISRTRPPRYVNPILGLVPYAGYDARGLSLQKMLNRGLYCDDTYWAHAELTPESKMIVLITLQHIFLIGKYKSWGSYEPVWVLKLDDLMTVPKIKDNKLIFSVRQSESSTTTWNEDKNVSSEDKQLLQWLKNQTEAALVISMEDKPCP